MSAFSTREQVIERLIKEVKALGGQNKLAKEIGVSKMFMSDVIRGHRRPTGKILEWLGLEERTTYVTKYVARQAKP